jgi:hypothetical protein
VFRKTKGLNKFVLARLVGGKRDPTRVVLQLRRRVAPKHAVEFENDFLLIGNAHLRGKKTTG